MTRTEEIKALDDRYLAEPLKVRFFPFALAAAEGNRLVDVEGRAYLDFGADWRNDFTATVAPTDMGNFRRAGVDPRDYVGKTVRLRGIVQFFHGPEIEIANPQQIEVAP